MKVKLQDISIDILMSTYNGEKYLVEQIESLVAQTHKNWHLLIRDDGSSDGTAGIIRSYTKAYPARITYVNELAKDSMRLGACFSFLNLLQYSEVEYIMFCDQDDVWLPNKVEITLQEMLRMEDSYAKNTPILVHTDLQVVDAALNILSPSACKYGNIKPKHNSLARMMVQNTVAGCTSMINLALKNKIRKVPEGVIIHDWWIALLAAAFGEISYMDIAPIYYRQHGGNVVGVKKRNIIYFLKKLIKTHDIKLKGHYLAAQKQARIFLNEYDAEFTEQQRAIITTFAELNQYNFFKRKILQVKNQYFAHAMIRNVFILLFC